MKSPSFWCISIVCFTLGLLPYLSLLIYNDPPMAVYGGINSLEELVRYVGRSAYNDDHAVAGGAEKLKYLVWLAKESGGQLGLFGVPLVLIGLGSVFRSRSVINNVSQMLIFFGTTFFLLGLINFEYSAFYQAIFRPYPVIAYAVLSYWFASGVMVVGAFLTKLNAKYSEPSSGSTHVVTYVVSIIVLCAVLLANYGQMDRREARLIDVYARIVLETLPRNSVLFTYGDNQTGPIGYLHYVEGVRPDVEVRDWSNLVFENRLSSPFLAPSEQQKVTEQFINQSERPVYSLQPRLSPATNFGLYHRFNPDGHSDFVFSPEINAFLDYLLQTYLDDLVTDGHEQHFLYNRLIAFSRQYIDYARLVGLGQLSQEMQMRLNLLQSIFPGKLVTLEVFLNETSKSGSKRERSTQKQIMLELASEAELQIPEYASLESLAVFYEYYGRVHAMMPVNREEAILNFNKSIAAWPVAENTSICPLSKLYEGVDDVSYDTLVNRFPEFTCQK